MELDLEQALRTGIQRTFKPTGLVLASAYFVLGTISAAAAQTLTAELGGTFFEVSQPSIALPVSAEIAFLLMMVAGLANTIASIVAVRTLVGEATERIPRQHLTRNMGYAFINIAVGGLAYSIAVLLGLVLFIVPGLYIMSALYFWTIYVAVEDQNFIEAFKSSWKLTEGNRLKVFLLLLVLMTISAVLSGVFGLAGLANLKIVGEILSAAAGAVTAIFTLAAVADLYRQLSD